MDPSPSYPRLLQVDIHRQPHLRRRFSIAQEARLVLPSVVVAAAAAATTWPTTDDRYDGLQQQLILLDPERLVVDLLPNLLPPRLVGALKVRKMRKTRWPEEEDEKSRLAWKRRLYYDESRLPGIDPEQNPFDGVSTTTSTTTISCRWWSS